MAARHMTLTSFLGEVGFGQDPTQALHEFPEYPAHSGRLQALAATGSVPPDTLQAIVALLTHARQLREQGQYGPEQAVLTQASQQLGMLEQGGGTKQRWLLLVVVLALIGVALYYTSDRKARPRLNRRRRRRASRLGPIPYDDDDGEDEDDA